MITWIKKTPYYLQTDGYTIAKTMNGLAVIYTLYHGDNAVKKFATVDAAKAWHKTILESEESPKTEW